MANKEFLPGPRPGEIPTVELYYFYTKWCPYCKKARIVWDKFKKKFDEIGEEFLSFIKDKRIIIHNAEFDIAHLNNELNLFGKNKISSYRVPNLLAGIAICILMGFFTFSILYNFASQSWSNSFTLSLLSVLFIAVNSGFAIEVRQAKTDTVLLLLCFIQQWIIWKIYSYGKLEWNIFKTNGAAEVALKLPCEFKIPLKRDDKETIKIYGKVMRP